MVFGESKASNGLTFMLFRMKSLEEELNRHKNENNNLALSLETKTLAVTRVEVDLEAAKKEIETLTNQHSNYKAKAQKILQDREKVISSLKNGVLQDRAQSEEAELDQIRLVSLHNFGSFEYIYAFSFPLY